MRVLITTDTVGGVWTFTQELAGQLLSRGWFIHLVSLGREPSPSQQGWFEDTASQYTGRFSWAALDVPLEWMEDNERAWPEAAPALIRMAHESGADLLHSNQFCFGALPINIPRIVTAHSDVLSWARACRPVSLDDSPWLRRYLELVRSGLSQAHAVVAPTNWMANSLLDDYPRIKRPFVISNGRTIPQPDAAPRRLQAITAGRLWDEAKNVAMLAEVHSPIPLLVAGDVQSGPEKKNAPPAGVTFLGSLASEELLRVFRESAMYLCTSRYEPFGLAPLEAALCGCAVLANDIPSLREVWQDGALYFNQADSLSSLLNRLCSEPDELARAQRQSLDRARTFTAARMVAAYEQLFHHWMTRMEDGRLCPAVSA
ncbi:MAG TPA: glycosyltransferase family 4 protein [Acidobacteriaceae bacterium]|nr:glycosyltransferase family 4 protein [Acidobacteriaceae bacterium]